MRQMLMVTAMAVTIVACGSDSTGPRSGAGALQLRVSQSTTVAASMVEAATLDGVPIPAVVRSQVASVRVTLSAVHALRLGANEENDGEWVRFPIVPAQTFDLLDLPSSVDNALALPRGVA